MGEPILKASEVPTRLSANKDQSVVKSDLDVDGVTWNVTCVSMGNPHCVTFGTKGAQVHDCLFICKVFPLNLDIGTFHLCKLIAKLKKVNIGRSKDIHHQVKTCSD